MVGDSATYVRLPALLLLLTFLNSACFVVSGELPSLIVAEYASLQISPKLVVEKSPGVRPGSHVVCERVEINGLSRFRNLTSFFSSVKVKVINVNSTGRPPNITICFHRNASLEVGMCPEDQWDKLTKGSWVKSMSPFDNKLIDIRIVGPSEGTIEVLLNKEFYSYRIVFLVLGVTLMTFASSLSNSLAVYYGGAMTLGVMLVVLVILFQGMRILPTGRKSSLGLVLYGSIVGVGSFLFSYIPTLLRSLLIEMGISEDVHSPLAVFLLAFVVLSGAWLGFWAVRKLVLTEDGSIDTGVAQFVSWAFRILASSLILQSSVDPLLAVVALVFGVVIPSAFKWFFKMLFKPNKVKHRRSYKRVSEDYYEEDHRIHKLQDKNTFYSSFHDTGERRQYSKEEWDEFTKESTKKALESLVCSPDFNRWAVANADRITLRPENDTNRTRKSWFSWS
ncbi:hypothetical protein L2E82_01790 [Cichorium intybus]|uniref:Uncharacterized protein n=1 Tax=Cichorium intybus TaxID=13427 RepID=A0ACB9H0H3_CICIN|nr:hypothetical protein L2E82_01790 [Cichorium intybus]